MTPFFTWMRSSPRSSLVMACPVACSTTLGPATNTWLVFLTMTLKWHMQAWTAGSPATEPSTAETTGTYWSSSAERFVPALPGRYVLPIFSKVFTLPPVASSSRT